MSADRHPISGPRGWEICPGLTAVMRADPHGGRPSVVLSNAGHMFLLPPESLTRLARGLMAAHVDGARPEWKGGTS